MTTSTTPTPDRMPALYIGHGAPPLLDDPVWSSELRALAARLPRPTGILIVSAHWESAPMSLSATAAAAPLVYDFGGFAPRYYQMTYATPDSSALARTVASLMPDTEPVHQHPSRGLDHGAWVPLKIMYPEADIPVLQMSLPTQDPERLLELGRRLRPLRDEGDGGPVRHARAVTRAVARRARCARRPRGRGRLGRTGLLVHGADPGSTLVARHPRRRAVPAAGRVPRRPGRSASRGPSRTRRPRR